MFENRNKSSCIQTGSLNLENFISELENYIKNLNELSEKLANACAELFIEARNLDKGEGYEQYIEDDYSIVSDVFCCISELERRRKPVTGQHPRQEGSIAQEGHHGFVNLPNLDFPFSNGDILHVSEFWD